MQSRLWQYLRIVFLVAAIAGLTSIYVQREHPEWFLRGRLVEREHVLLYLPEVKSPTPRPVLIALSPIRDARTMVWWWIEAADELGWVIIGSKDFQNGIDPTSAFDSIFAAIRELSHEMPLDERRIVSTGISGGAMGSHILARNFPDRIAGVILNTGMIHESFLKDGESYPRNKLAAFEASPTDFRYQEMKRDEAFLRARGWKTWWREFEGGHTLAPTSLNREALRWIDSQLRESRPPDLR